MSGLRQYCQCCALLCKALHFKSNQQSTRHSHPSHSHHSHSHPSHSHHTSSLLPRLLSLLMDVSASLCTSLAAIISHCYKGSLDVMLLDALATATALLCLVNRFPTECQAIVVYLCDDCELIWTIAHCIEPIATARPPEQARPQTSDLTAAGVAAVQCMLLL